MQAYLVMKRFNGIYHLLYADLEITHKKSWKKSIPG